MQYSVRSVHDLRNLTDGLNYAGFVIRQHDRDQRPLGFTERKRERGKINNTTSALARFTRDIRYRIKKLLKPNEHTYGIEWIYGHDVTAGTRAKEPAEAA